MNSNPVAVVFFLVPSALMNHWPFTVPYNESLVKFAKEKGIKGIRTGLRTATLIRKITEAGYEVPERE